MEGKRTKESDGTLIQENVKYREHFKVEEKSVFIKSR